ncbi:MAG: hypothetical protein ACYDBX_01425 [Patescibacteria group bacterium]
MNEQDPSINNSIERAPNPAEGLYQSLFDIYLDLRRVTPEIESIKDPEVQDRFSYQLTRTLGNEGISIVLVGYVYKKSHIKDPGRLRYTKMEIMFLDDMIKERLHVYKILFSLVELDKLKYRNITDDIRSGKVEGRRFGVPEIEIDGEEVDIRKYHKKAPEIQLLERILKPTIDPDKGVPKLEEIILERAIAKYHAQIDCN